MSALLWRVLIAILCCVLAWALIPPVLRIVGLNLDGDVLLVLRICIGGLALLYILRGPTPPSLS